MIGITMTKYLDAVLDNMKPVYNGTPEDTVRWLKAHPEAKLFDVCVGKTMQMFTVTKYLEMAPKDDKVRDEEKLARVTELVMAAMSKQDAATYFGDTRGMDLVAEAFAKRILDLFEQK